MFKTALLQRQARLVEKAEERGDLKSGATDSHILAEKQAAGALQVEKIMSAIRGSMAKAADPVLDRLLHQASAIQVLQQCK